MKDFELATVLSELLGARQGIQELTDDAYVVNVANMCNWQITQLKTRSGQVFNYNPPIGKTCGSHDYAACKKDGKFVQLLQCSCRDATFGVILHLKHPAGWEGDTQVVSISPNCQYAGTVIGLDIPDPRS